MHKLIFAFLLAGAPLYAKGEDACISVLLENTFEAAPVSFAVAPLLDGGELTFVVERRGLLSISYPSPSPKGFSTSKVPYVELLGSQRQVSAVRALAEGDIVWLFVQTPQGRIFRNRLEPDPRQIDRPRMSPNWIEMGKAPISMFQPLSAKDFVTIDEGRIRLSENGVVTDLGPVGVEAKSFVAGLGIQPHLVDKPTDERLILWVVAPGLKAPSVHVWFKNTAESIDRLTLFIPQIPITERIRSITASGTGSFHGVLLKTQNLGQILGEDDPRANEYHYYESTEKGWRLFYKPQSPLMEGSAPASTVADLLDAKAVAKARNEADQLMRACFRRCGLFPELAREISWRVLKTDNPSQLRVSNFCLLAQILMLRSDDALHLIQPVENVTGDFRASPPRPSEIPGSHLDNFTLDQMQWAILQVIDGLAAIHRVPRRGVIEYMHYLLSVRPERSEEPLWRLVESLSATEGLRL